MNASANEAGPATDRDVPPAPAPVCKPPVAPALVVILSVALIASGVWAEQLPGGASLLFQPVPPASERVPEQDAAAEKPVEFILRVEPRLTFRADLRGTGADLLASHNPFDATIIYKPSDDFRLTFTLGGEVSHYDWGAAETALPGGSKAFDDMYSANALLAVRWTVSGRWAAVAGGFARAQGEGGADFGESITGGGFAGVGYNFSRESWIDLGVGAAGRLEDDPIIVPYVNLRLPIAERVRLEIRGLEAGLISTVSDQWEVALRGRLEYRDFRLDDSRPAWRDGVARDLRVPIGVEVAWKPVEGLTIGAEAGAVVYQKFEFRDNAGRDLGDVETEPAAYVGLRVEYRF